MSQPTMTCDKCGYQREVNKSPESTRRWFQKYHATHCSGTPIYQAGIDPALNRAIKPHEKA